MALAALRTGAYTLPIEPTAVARVRRPEGPGPFTRCAGLPADIYSLVAGLLELWLPQPNAPQAQVVFYMKAIWQHLGGVAANILFRGNLDVERWLDLQDAIRAVIALATASTWGQRIQYPALCSLVVAAGVLDVAAASPIINEPFPSEFTLAGEAGPLTNRGSDAGKQESNTKSTSPDCACASEGDGIIAPTPSRKYDRVAQQVDDVTALMQAAKEETAPPSPEGHEDGRQGESNGDRLVEAALIDTRFCPQGHRMVHLRGNEGARCATCLGTAMKRLPAVGCNACNYAVCGVCGFDDDPPRGTPICTSAHPLRACIPQDRGRCGACDGPIGGGRCAFSCAMCNFDTCYHCYKNAQDAVGHDDLGRGTASTCNNTALTPFVPTPMLGSVLAPRAQQYPPATVITVGPSTVVALTPANQCPAHSQDVNRGGSDDDMGSLAGMPPVDSNDKPEPASAHALPPLPSSSPAASGSRGRPLPPPPPPKPTRSSIRGVVRHIRGVRGGKGLRRAKKRALLLGLAALTPVTRDEWDWADWATWEPSRGGGPSSSIDGLVEEESTILAQRQSLVVTQGLPGQGGGTTNTHEANKRAGGSERCCFALIPAMALSTGCWIWGLCVRDRVAALQDRIRILEQGHNRDRAALRIFRERHAARARECIELRHGMRGTETAEPLTTHMLQQ